MGRVIKRRNEGAGEEEEIKEAGLRGRVIKRRNDGGGKEEETKDQDGLKGENNFF